jgi:hypothetical protein
MAKKRPLSKEYHEVLAKEEEERDLISSLEAQTQELMSCGFKYAEAQAWLRKKHISNIFEKDERVQR